MNRYSELIEKCSEDIRNGHTKQALHRLGRLNTSRVPRPYRAKLAFLCRRVGLLAQGFRLLTPLIYPKRSDSPPASPAETSEYACLLQTSGNLDEALQLLSRVDVDQSPQTLLYQAYCHLQKWNSAAAVSCLNAYLLKPLSREDKQLGQLNLASALIGVQAYEESKELISEILSDCATERLRNGCHLIRAGIYIQRGEYAAAKHDLLCMDQLERLIPIDRIDHLEMMSVVEAFEQKSIGPILDYKKLAIQSGHWIGVRNADLYQLKIVFNAGLFKHLYFGTPYPSFRARIERELGYAPKEELYVLGPKRAPRLDLRTGEIDGKILMRPGQKIHQLLAALLRDFYVPMQLGALCSELFPDERFHFESSPAKVHQLVWRARKWVEDHNYGFAITETMGRYSIELKSDFSFLVPIEQHGINSIEAVINRLSKKFPDQKQFTAKMAREFLGISSSAFKEVAKKSLELGYLAKQGENRLTRYCVAAARPDLKPKAA